MELYSFIYPSAIRSIMKYLDPFIVSDCFVHKQPILNKIVHPKLFIISDEKKLFYLRQLAYL